MTTFRGLNGTLTYIQVSGKVTYAYGETVRDGALFKVLVDVTAKNVTVTYMDGSVDTNIDAQILSDMNAVVQKVVAGAAPILITEFGLYI